MIFAVESCLVQHTQNFGEFVMRFCTAPKQIPGYDIGPKARYAIYAMPRSRKALDQNCQHDLDENVRHVTRVTKGAGS